MCAYGVAMIKAGINSYAWTIRNFPLCNCSKRGEETFTWIFTINSKFDTVAANYWIFIFNLLTIGNTKLRAN